MTRTDIALEMLMKGKDLKVDDTEWYRTRIMEGVLSDGKKYRVEYNWCKLALKVAYCTIIRINKRDGFEHYLGVQKIEGLDF